jgi:ABC-2 type transport system ATP-binding protein
MGNAGESGGLVTTPAIRFENLTKTFGSVRALTEITLDVPPGCVFALIGPNGAGKSTAVKTMMNILRPNRGHVEVLGIDSRHLTPRAFTEIGYVSENQQLPEWMTVAYFLAYCKEFYPNWSENEAAALVKSFELPPDRPLRTLSRGMRMKAALASSMAYRPRLLVLDEPFSGLDVLVREELIESILERDLTVFIASHDLGEIESFASHIGYISDGRVQFTEEMQTLGQRYREVEITLDRPVTIPDSLPEGWLNLESAGAVVRLTDSQYHRERTEGAVRQLFGGVREISARGMPLRAIFVALARQSRRARS